MNQQTGLFPEEPQPEQPDLFGDAPAPDTRPGCQAGRYVRRPGAQLSQWQPCPEVAVRDGYCLEHLALYELLQGEGR